MLKQDQEANFLPTDSINQFLPSGINFNVLLIISLMSLNQSLTHTLTLCFVLLYQNTQYGIIYTEQRFISDSSGRRWKGKRHSYKRKEGSKHPYIRNPGLA